MNKKAKKPVTDWNQFRKVFIKNNLRMATFRWPPRGAALKAARVERCVNTATGKLCWFIQCASCSTKMLEREGKLDHVEPVVSIQGQLLPSMRNYTADQSTAFDLGTYVLRMLPEQSGWQVLCAGCHNRKTGEERDERTKARHSAKAVRNQS